MKKITINSYKILTAGLALMIISFAGTAYSQDHKVELTPFGGYLLGGSIKFYQGKFKIENNACYGGMLAVQVHKGSFIELSYTGMGTRGDWRPYNNYNIDYPAKTVDIAINYLQIGSINEIPLDNEAIRPYGTLSLGAAWLHPKEGASEDAWIFAVALGGGLKYFFSERIGIRIQARMLMPLIFNGAGFYMGVGTGGASGGLYISSTTPIIQGDFTGGLIIALGDY